MDQVLALRTFVRIAEAGSLAKAAGSLDLPRSTVSKLLQDLEKHLGVRLVARTTRATTITPEGDTYYRRAVQLLSDLDEMDAATGGTAVSPSGRLRIDIGSSLANLILIPRLSDFFAQYPDIDLVVGVNDRAVDLVGDGIDCVIRGGELADSSLVARRLCELDFVTCATPGYFERHGRPVALRDLETGHAALAYFSASTGSTFPLRFRTDSEAREVRPRAGTSVNESTAHMTGLLAGLGIGQTFEFVARPYLRDGQLEEVLSAFRPAPHPLHIVYSANRHPTAKLRAFADWASDIFKRATRNHD